LSQPTHPLTRRSFLRQSFAFSALASGVIPVHAFAAPDMKAQHVLMIGDWGNADSQVGQHAVAAAMVRYAKANTLETQALFLLGDNWYGNLSGGADSPRFKTQFEDIYPASTFPGPAYAVLGNHDYQRIPLTVSKVQAQLEYARRGHTRWTQPHLWYSFDLHAADKSPLMRVIVLDSNVPHSMMRFDPVDFALTQSQYDEQLAWFKTEIAKPTAAPFTIVIAHHPIFSNGPHGDHATLIRDWEPILREHKVPLYLAGHDHDLQHLEFEGHPTSFVCSGAGGADLYDLKITEAARGPFADKVYGFTHLQIEPTQLTVRHVDSSGKILHAFTKSLDGSVKLLG
jgi:diadenosine tetraphosphatase ApaH/serine/threonine PP2A family protein phosphatase